MTVWMMRAGSTAVAGGGYRSANYEPTIDFASSNTRKWSPARKASIGVVSPNRGLGVINQAALRKLVASITPSTSARPVTTPVSLSRSNCHLGNLNTRPSTMASNRPSRAILLMTGRERRTYARTSSELSVSPRIRSRKDAMAASFRARHAVYSSGIPNRARVFD
jgi:hypothetical protein